MPYIKSRFKKLFLEWWFPVLVLAGVGALFWPGSLTNDSVGWLIRARTGEFSDVQPIGPSLVWRWLEHLYPGPFPFVLFNLMLLVSFTHALLKKQQIRTPWLAGIGLLCFIFYPPVLTICGIVWRDVTGLGVTIATAVLALFFWLENKTPSRKHILQYLGLALAITFFGAMFRLNHAAGVFPFLVIIAWKALFALKQNITRALASIFLALFIGTVATCLAYWVSKKFSEPAYAFQARTNYMLSRISTAAGQNYFPEALFPLVKLDHLEQLLQQKNAYHRVFWKAFSRQDNPMFPRIDNEKDYAQLQMALNFAIMENPLIFMKFRLAEFIQWWKFSNDYRSGTLRTGIPDLSGFGGLIEANFPTATPKRSQEFLTALNQFNRHRWANNPLYILTAGVVICGLSLFIFPLPRILFPLLLVLGGLTHYLGLTATAFDYEFRHGHQSIAMTWLAILLLLIMFLDRKFSADLPRQQLKAGLQT